MADPQELPPCECFDAPTEGFNICRPCYALAELGLTREGISALRAKAERCEHAEEVAEFQEVRADKADSTIDALRTRAENAGAALAEARVHVYRQTTGRHEQDRADAHAWLDKWGNEAWGPTTKGDHTPEGS